MGQKANLSDCVNQIISLLRERDMFVIAGHIGPDGDTIGSCLGLAMALGKLGKKAIVLLEPFAAKYRIIPGKKHLHHGAVDALPVDVFIALDCADVERLGFARPLFDRAATTICIDHHETNVGFAGYNFIDPAASSTAEMVFELIDAITEVDKDIATAIYAGIVGDTGGFRFISTGKPTMDIAARLMETGIPFTDIYTEMLHRHSFEAAKAFGLALGACATAMGGRIVYTYMTREMFIQVGAESSDMDSVAEYLINTRGADVALFLYEKHPKAEDATDKTIKVSMRSREFHVGKVAASLGGGGHRLAAGCTITGTMDDVLLRVLEELERELLG